jgi:hypothetical protein
MRLVVLAHARSGTSYTAACFRAAGWDVGHERIGRDGIASWMWATDAEEVPLGPPRGYYPLPETVLHVIREPAAAVSSITHTEQASEEWRSRWVPIPPSAGPIERAVWSLHGWTALIRDLRPTHTAQLRHVEAAVETITGSPPGHVKGSRNARLHPALSADQIKATVWQCPETAQLWEEACMSYEEAAL